MTHAVGATADPSFPSGHVAFTASFAAVLICALWTTRWRGLGIHRLGGGDVSGGAGGSGHAGDPVGRTRDTTIGLVAAALIR